MSAKDAEYAMAAMRTYDVKRGMAEGIERAANVCERYGASHPRERPIAMKLAAKIRKLKEKP